jgi:hypothetical protein
MEVGTHNLVPELTVTSAGVYWHPLVSPSQTDTLVREQIFPLSSAIECIRQKLETSSDPGDPERSEFQ